MKKILFIDRTHPFLKNALEKAGYRCDEMLTEDKEEIITVIPEYYGLVLRSRIPIDRELLQNAGQLAFIARAGAGMENIDVKFAEKSGIKVFSAPEGNRNAVAEHTLGMLLALLNKIITANKEVKSGKWRREANRGIELEGKTVGIIGYGNMGKAFARKLQGFDTRIICYDIKSGVGDSYARQTGLDEFFALTDVVSLHVPINEKSYHMVNAEFISSFQKNFYLLNTARGEVVVTRDLTAALQSGKILGAALDVLEYEKSSFENFFDKQNLPENFEYLIQASNVILTPHVAGWSVESKEKLARVLWEKIKKNL